MELVGRVAPRAPSENETELTEFTKWKPGIPFNSVNSVFYLPAARGATRPVFGRDGALRRPRRVQRRSFGHVEDATVPPALRGR